MNGYEKKVKFAWFDSREAKNRSYIDASAWCLRCYSYGSSLENQTDDVNYELILRKLLSNSALPTVYASSTPEGRLLSAPQDRTPKETTR